MKSSTSYSLKVFATGFIVLTLLSIPLFWLRSLCQTAIAELMPREIKSVDISPSGLVPPELENDPNVAQHSRVGASINSEVPSSIGLADYFITRLPGASRSNVYLASSDEAWMYFDKNLGQIVHQYDEKSTMPDNSTLRKIIRFYIGPKGISELPDEKLGRFFDPILDGNWIVRRWEKAKPRELILYDKKLRCFFRIDFDQRTVVKGPEVKKGFPNDHPIQIGRLYKNEFSLDLNWSAPHIKVPRKDADRTDLQANINDSFSIRLAATLKDADRTDLQANIKPIIPTGFWSDSGPYLLVLDETGRIELLDRETLELAGSAGWLPGPRSYFYSEQSQKPKDLLAYEVQALTLRTHYFENPEEVITTFGDTLYNFARQPSRVDKEYLGMFAASVSRDGTALVLTVFDKESKRITTEHTKLSTNVSRPSEYLHSSKAAFWRAPWAPVSTIGKYLAENLHPPILSLASYFTASVFEAGSGHRALFLLPNSFVAMVGRDSRGNFAERFASALWWILPSIVLAAWLAYWVSKDAVVVGLSGKARFYWIIGTIAFGLTGYITYRLTRPKITLVTCANCGKPRRPDMDKCHRCGSGWQVPELIPPAWRVLNGTEQVPDSSTADAEQAVPE